MNEQNTSGLNNQQNEMQPKKLPSKKIVLIAVIAGILVIAGLLAFLLTANIRKYNKAVRLIEKGDYVAAYEILSELGDYKDAAQHVKRFHFVPKKWIDKRVSNDMVLDSITVDISFNEQNLPEQIKTVRSYNLSYGQEYTSTEIITYSYDANGNRIKEVHTAEDGYEDIFDYTYDEIGNLIKMSHAFANSDSKETFDYTYDEKGNMIQEVYRLNDCLQYTKKYTYNESGDITVGLYTYADGSKDIDSRTYDEKGNLIKSVYTHADGSRATYDFTYTVDANQNIIKKICTSVTGAVTTQDYTYDEKGNMIKEVYTKFDGSVYVYEYTFDASGNCVKAVCSTGEGWTLEVCETEYELVYIPYDLTDEEVEAYYEKIIVPFAYTGH